MRPRTDWEGAADTSWDAPVNGADYDALADLFLAGAPPAARPAEAQSKPTNGAAPRADAPPIPDARRDESPELDADASDALQPTFEAAVSAPTPSVRRAVCDVEALVLGHLPAMTGAWVTQHARASAEASALPVALVRVTAGLASVELIGAPGTQAPGTPGPGNPGAPCTTIEEAIGVAAATAGRFMIRVEATEEPGLCATEGVASITLLTGADEPAALAAYGAVKGMLRPTDSESSPDASALAADEGAGEEPRRPALRVVFMGASEDDARAAGAKIRSAARAFLGADVEFGWGASRLSPTPSVALFRGRANAPTRSIVAAVVAAARSVSGALIARQAAGSTDDSTPTFAADAHAAPSHERGPTATALPQAAASAPAPGESVALPLPGASLLPLRSPDAPGVSFARDGEGRLHLVCEECPDAAARLLAARAWAARHSELLALALRGAGAPSVSLDQPIAMHVLTATPSRWAGLRHTEIRVRALVNGASVEVS